MHQPIAYLPARVGIQMLSAEKCSTCWFLHSSIDNEQVARTANMCDNTHTTSDYHPKHDSSIFCHVSCCVHIQTFLYTKCSKTWCFCRLIVKNQTWQCYGNNISFAHTGTKHVVRLYIYHMTAPCLLVVYLLLQTGVACTMFFY